LIVKLAMFGFALLAAFRTEERARRDGRNSDALTGLCIMTAGIGLLIHCMFGSFLASEWAYWVMALLIRYSELYAVGEQVAEQPLHVLPALQGGPRAA
jgi:hypothetical protein